VDRRSRNSVAGTVLQIDTQALFDGGEATLNRGFGKVASHKAHGDRSHLRYSSRRCLRAAIRAVDRVRQSASRLWDFEEGATANLKDKWDRWGAGVQLVVLPSPYREVTRPLLRYINRVAKQNGNEIITVVLPEFIPAKWWQHFLHNQSSLLLKGSLLFKKGVIVTSVPYHLEQ
jgi:chemotaxis regulatin CheY-phosphate phosphatase CheZ